MMKPFNSILQQNLAILQQKLLVLFYFAIHVPCPIRTFDSHRIITDLEIVEQGQGVSLDFSFNETRSNIRYRSADYKDLISSPGCPQSIDGLPWVYFGDSGKCYLVGYQGPCQYSEVVMLETAQSTYGICACSCLQDERISDLEKSKDGRYIFCPSYSNHIYDSWEEVCLSTFSQGPCNDGQVFIRLANSTEVKCVDDDKGECGFRFYNYETRQCDDYPSGNLGFGGSLYGVQGPILPSHCGGNEHYSSFLKKCLKKGKQRGLILG